MMMKIGYVYQYPKIIEIAFLPLSLKFSRSKKPPGSTAQKDKFTYSFSLHRKTPKTGLFLTTQKGMNCCLTRHDSIKDYLLRERPFNLKRGGGGGGGGGEP